MKKNRNDKITHLTSNKTKALAQNVLKVLAKAIIRDNTVTP
jgi:hypothetical protein